MSQADSAQTSSISSGHFATPQPQSGVFVNPQQNSFEPSATSPGAFRTIGTNWSLVVVCLVAVLITVFSVSAGTFDNDMWWLLATGQEVVENGIPYTNPWSIHEGLDTVIQQWLAAVILYGVYSLFGYMGLKFFVVIQSLVLAVVLFGLCRIVSGHRHGSGEIFAIVIAVSFVALSAYLSVRPHLYSMTLFALVLAALELYRLQHRKKWLIVVPVLVMIHVNVHAAMAPFDLFIIALYLIPDIPAFLHRFGMAKNASFSRMDYPRLPVLIALIASAIALLINPYGIRGAAYLVLSYGAAGYSNYINEMGSTGFWTDYGKGAMAAIVLGAIAIGHNGQRRIDPPLTILFIVCIPLSMMHTRNVWLVALFAIPLFARSFGAMHLTIKKLKALSNRLFNGVLAAALVAIGLAYAATAQWPEVVENAEKDTSSLPSAAADYLDQYCESHNVDKKSLRLYNSFNNGGYLEWRGYKVFIDPRPELWEPAITNNERHYYQEFVDFAQNKVASSDLLGEYNFDFLIVYTSSDFNTYMRNLSTYEVATSGSGYVVYARLGMLSTDDRASSNTVNSTTSASGNALANDVKSLGNVDDINAS